MLASTIHQHWSIDEPAILIQLVEPAVYFVIPIINSNGLSTSLGPGVSTPGILGVTKSRRGESEWLS